MDRTLEETVLEAMDGLFRGALFLCGGDAAQAAERVERLAATAFRLQRETSLPVPDPRALDRLLVRDVLADPPGPASDPGPEGVGPLDLGEVSADAVLRAAGAVPLPARAALWLVLIERWPYAEAADALGTDTNGLRAQLAYRDLFMAAAFGRGDSNGRVASV